MQLVQMRIIFRWRGMVLSQLVRPGQNDILTDLIGSRCIDAANDGRHGDHHVPPCEELMASGFLI